VSKIKFTEPSTGTVSSDNTTALTIKATGKNSTALYAESSADSTTAIVGKNSVAPITLWTKGIGVYGEGPIGVKGKATKGGVEFAGVSGEGAHGVRGVSIQDDSGVGVIGESHGKKSIGVYGVNTNNVEPGIGVRGSSYGIGVLATGKPAGRFEGNVEVTGDISLLNADCAEDFDVLEENIEPGTVMVLNETGSLQPSYKEYDKKVAGIVSGAGGYKPAIILDSRHSRSLSGKDQCNNKNRHRLPIALMGKVYCKVDARNSSIEIGDLLTTSSIEGFAMKASDPIKAFGCVIGKALGSIKEGLGLIPILVTLQ